MVIYYKKSRLNQSLIFGVAWLVLGLFWLFYSSDSYYGYGYLVISIVLLGAYTYEKRNQYLKIENGIIYKKSIFGKEMRLDEVKEIKYFAGDYTLKSDAKTLKISTELIDENSIANLKEVLSELPSIMINFFLVIIHALFS